MVPSHRLAFPFNKQSVGGTRGGRQDWKVHSIINFSGDRNTSDFTLHPGGSARFGPGRVLRWIACSGLPSLEPPRGRVKVVGFGGQANLLRPRNAPELVRTK
ncbi:hypothetical protein RSSM_02906 [Rhodopirellula sallentina SM41]|uniref:Uncharacterized protein n=1 Tax=Rhodopirellula sallentina SM41 TaxID=1263870 RepID=M5UCN4_9BACT|nr:hypothetical protein RSSM_02906 [Rhodopirellula sallentina SM41]